MEDSRLVYASFDQRGKGFKLKPPIEQIRVPVLCFQCAGSF